MHPPSCVADKRPFQMNAHRASACRLVLFDAGGYMIQGEERLFDWGRYGGRQVAGHSMMRQKPADYPHAIFVHQVAARAAMNVEIQKTRGDDSVAKIDSIRRRFSLCARSDLDNRTVINQHKRLFNAFAWRNQCCGREGDHEFGSETFYRTPGRTVGAAGGPLSSKMSPRFLCVK